MKQRSNFKLSKWYMDCVSDAGDVFIGYAATLRWKAFSLNYSSILDARYGEPIRASTSLLKFSAPEIFGPMIVWSSDSLCISAAWKALAPPIEHPIFESELGDIKWTCIAPIAETEVDARDRPGIKGLGYVEHISLTAPPWQLPIDELRWGRFLSRDDHLTWIDWRGPHPITLVFHNGVAIDGARVSDDEISFSTCRLTIAKTDQRILREGALISTALAMILGVKKVIPRRILDAHEIKWCGRGVLERPGARQTEGWVINEVVRWGQ